VPVEVAAGSRYVTYPLIFACLSAVVALRLVVERVAAGYWRWIIGAAAGAWMAASLANVRITIPLWKDDVILHTWAMRQAGPSFWRQANIGLHYFRAGEFDRARDAFAASVALRDDKHSAWVWENLGLTEARLGRLYEALKAFQRAVALEPEVTRFRVSLGRTQRELGDAPAAVQTLRHGLQLLRGAHAADPDQRRLRYELGLSYADIGRTMEAIAQLEAALAIARNTSERRMIEEALATVRQPRQ
jgi:tetratricopeptide (TPR) repeat protein